MQVCRHAYMLVRWQAVTPVCRCMGACPIYTHAQPHLLIRTKTRFSSAHGVFCIRPHVCGQEDVSLPVSVLTCKVNP